MVHLVIVSLHWGIEYTTTPTPEQRQIAYFLIDQGADLILGHRPHVIQGIETYRDRPIVYSLGNFIFDSITREGQDTIIFTFRVDGKGLGDFKIYPVVVDRSQPRLAVGTAYRRIADIVLSRSATLGLFLRDEGNVLSIP